MKIGCGNQGAQRGGVKPNGERNPKLGGKDQKKCEGLRPTGQGWVH